MTFIGEARKFLVALVGLAAVLLSAGLVNGNAKAILTGIVALATVLGVYVVPNKAPATPAP